MPRIDGNKRDALGFAALLNNGSLKNNRLSKGKFSMKGRKGVDEVIQYNQKSCNLLINNEYTFKVKKDDLQVSLQLYKNTSNHYRLFCYTRVGKIQGMTFSINLTTKKIGKNLIQLSQHVRFIEQYHASIKNARAYRRKKQILFCDLLRKLGYKVTANNKVELGVFNSKEGKLINISVETFLNDFVVLSILKGHIQGNKGYHLDSYRQATALTKGLNQDIHLS